MTHHWQSLGWTLVHFLWQGAAIALLYRIADRLLAAVSPSRGANARYLLALVALLSMPAVAMATLVYEEAAMARHAGLPVARTASDTATAGSALLSLQPTSATASETAPLTNRVSPDAVMPYLDVVWLAGVFFCALRALGGWWLIRRLRLITLDQAPHTLLLLLDVLRRQMGIGHLVDLRLSRRIMNPLTAGVLRPWILLPITALTSLSPEQLEAVLAHELAHIRRADYFWNLLQTMVETLFFFHPAVWYLSRRVREEREFCCDDAVLVRCADPAVYASALVRLEEERRGGLRFAMALDGHQPAGLRARILRILGDPEPRRTPIRPLSLTVIAAALLLFLCPLPAVFASFHPAPNGTPIPVSPVAAPIASPDNPAQNPPSPPPQTQPAPKPSAATPAASPEPAPAPTPSDTAEAEPQSAPSGDAQTSTSGHSDYIDRMRAAGYDVDLDKYIAMKVQGITPEYAAQMAKIFGSKPTAGQLIAMKVQDVTPEYVAQMRADGYDAPADKLISMRIQGVTPEYADAMAKLGFGKPTVDDLISMRVQGVTPDEAAKLKADGIDVSSFQDLITYRIFNVSPEFVAQMKAAGFGTIPAKKLVSLRVQGVTPEFAKAMKAQFPDVTIEELTQMRIFNIDDKFIASAKSHGFAPLTVQKLVKLRISGILDDESLKQ